MKLFPGALIALIAFTPWVVAADAAPPDPKVRMAQLAKEDIEKAEKEVSRTEADILKENDAAIAAMKIDKPEAEKAAMAGMKELASRGRKLGKAVLDGHAAYTLAAKSLKAAYRRGPGTFRDAAGTFRKYAAEEAFEEIKRDYVTCAVTWETLADAMEKRVTAVEAEEKEIAETLKFVERSVLFLERFEAFAAAYPEMTDADQRSRFLDQLRRYVEAYEGLRGNLGKFHDQLKKQAIAPDLRPNFGDALASAVPAPPKPVETARSVQSLAPKPLNKPVAPVAVEAPRSVPSLAPRKASIPADAAQIGEFNVVENGVAYRVRVFYAPNPVPQAGGTAIARR